MRYLALSICKCLKRTNGKSFTTQVFAIGHKQACVKDVTVETIGQSKRFYTVVLCRQGFPLRRKS